MSTAVKNRLSKETSPYLRQHEDNPVDWYPWGEEAFSRARLEDKPILLSIGYSACHWCHVMAHECFENPQIAKIQNEHFINIKLDREERPDVDEIYMQAVQVMTGRGGWPLNVFLTPDLKPFFGGTYFPPEARHGLISWPDLLLRISEHYSTRRIEVVSSQQELVRVISGMADKSPGQERSAEDIFQKYTEQMYRSFDAVDGGFSPAPKFPHATDLRLLMRMETIISGQHMSETALFTLRKMACGGIYDQLGGGFHRYSVDARWLVPHFEKMLYDNALLVPAYLDAARVSGDGFYNQVARETLDYVLREMTDDAGAFYSAQDADTNGVEGETFVWKKNEIIEILGKSDGQVFCSCFGVTEDGNFEHGKSVLHFTGRAELVAQEEKKSVAEIYASLEESRKKLLSTRLKRPQPGRDDKILASWNALMISAMARGYLGLDDKKYLEAALKAKKYLFDHHFINGGNAVLMRVSGRDDKGMRLVKVRGLLEDYAYLISASLDLFEATGDVEHLGDAQKLTALCDVNFLDDEKNSYFSTEKNAADLIVRTRTVHDSSLPSAVGVMAENLLRLGLWTGEKKYDERAQAVIQTHLYDMARVPRACAQLIAVYHQLENPAAYCIIIGQDAEAIKMQQFLRQQKKSIATILLNPGEYKLWSQYPALARELKPHTQAFYCAKGTCHAPVREVSELQGIT